MKPKAAIIGLDGVPIHLLKDLAKRGTMPHMKELISQGCLVKMRSSLPANSAASWSSMITGTDPGTHGVYGFTDFIPGTYTVCYHSSSKLKAPPFWGTEPGKRVLVINLPATYPAQPLNGAMITGFVSPQLDKAVYPPSLLPQLRESGYEVDVDASLFEKSIPLFLQKLEETLDRRTRVLDRLLERKDYDLLFFVVTGTDRIEHYLWDAYEDDTHDKHQEFLGFFEKVDAAVGHVASKLDPDAPLMMLSDHGMGPAETAVNLNTLLRDEGYLVAGDSPRKNYNNVRGESRAFAAESTKMYLNRVGRFPRGSVKPEDTQRVQGELVDLLRGLRYNGGRVVKAVHLKQDVFRGPEAGSAPDLVVTPAEGFSLKTGLFKESLFEEDSLAGTHTEDDAFLYLRGMSRGDLPGDPCIGDSIHVFRKMYGEMNVAA
ncbi:alkaline phosphatase family protein [Candidatus Bathyarchaeota archaeon]|nr:alkaline phosphatase family protein [Candidatus Bathyarchaeota archaeon]